MPRRLVRAGHAFLTSVPRVLSLVWAWWCVETALAYVEGAPPQLERAEQWLHMPIWWVWAAAAGLLVLGALVPPQAGPRAEGAARWMRIIGISLTAGMLALWAVEFYATDAGRGWVSGKNYRHLALAAMASAFLVGRERAVTRPVGEVTV